eukprot:366558-Chlamydomonas_euryale.AAC.10
MAGEANTPRSAAGHTLNSMQTWAAMMYASLCKACMLVRNQSAAQGVTHGTCLDPPPRARTHTCQLTAVQLSTRHV